MVRLIDRPDMTLDVYRGRKTTKHPCFSVIFTLEITFVTSVCFPGKVSSSKMRSDQEKINHSL